MSARLETNLETTSREYLEAEKRFRRRVVICAGTGCMANGALKVFKALHEQARAQGIRLEIELDYEDETAKAGLLTKLALGGLELVLVRRIQLARGYFPYHAVVGIAKLPLHDHLAALRKRNYRNRAMRLDVFAPAHASVWQGRLVAIQVEYHALVKER